MVKDSREKACIGAIRPLNPLKTATVFEGFQGEPILVGSSLLLRVSSIEDKWRIDDEWWREHPISRVYYDCLLENGRRLVLVKDLITDTWNRQTG